jgi:uncharacterized protein YndB with AHSA1/START domain
MGRELRVFVAAVAGTVALWFGVGAVIPDHYEVATTITIAAPPERVVPLLADFRSWRDWSALASTVRADTEFRVEGDAGVPGHRIVWRAGSQEALLQLTAAGAGGIEYDFLSRVDQDSAMTRHGHGFITAHADGAGSAVAWREEMWPQGLQRWFAWFGAQQDAVRRFQAASLGALRARFEKPAK